MRCWGEIMAGFVGKNQEENASKLPSWEILVPRALSAAVVAAAKAGGEG